MLPGRTSQGVTDWILAPADPRRIKGAIPFHTRRVKNRCQENTHGLRTRIDISNRPVRLLRTIVSSEICDHLRCGHRRGALDCHICRPIKQECYPIRAGFRTFVPSCDIHQIRGFIRLRDCRKRDRVTHTVIGEVGHRARQKSIE
jgi:hypothetical protein